MSTFTDAEIVEVAREFVKIWADLAQDLPHNYGCTLNCDEAETLAHLFVVFGKDDVADSIVECHAEFDELGDAHYESEDE
ncbi:hypothetical protein [Spirillospora sp. NPDC047279]|uniref:hypothetical protein n=1 Tax=Spirillospora sp. NPDC047279 TaxID=3155478 RepID=UPI0033C52664